jgi:hypothetical protein
MAGQRNILAMAIGALSVGVLFYALDRQHEHVYFLPKWIPSNNSPAGFIGSIGDYLPTFIHVYAFILLTVIVAAPPVTKLIPVCVAWFTLDGALEVAQMQPIAQWLARHTPDWFSGIPFFENTARYFLFGTFDVRDLLSIAAGTLGAYMTVRISQGGSGLNNDKPQ